MGQSELRVIERDGWKRLLGIAADDDKKLIGAESIHGWEVPLDPLLTHSNEIEDISCA